MGAAWNAGTGSRDLAGPLTSSGSVLKIYAKKISFSLDI